jgi:hypothetical protein
MHHTISAQTSQEGIECTTVKKWLRAYCPDIYTVERTKRKVLMGLGVVVISWVHDHI